MPPPSYDRLFGDLDARVRSLEGEVERIRTWRHDFPQEFFIPLQIDVVEMKSLVQELHRRLNRDEQARDRLRGDRAAAVDTHLASPVMGIWSSHIIWRDVYIYASGIGTFYGFGKLMGWF